MRVKLEGIDGLFAVGECGIVDLDLYEDQEPAVENKNYGNFEKKELFWAVYDQIILPVRETAGVDPDHSIRLLFIEDDGDELVLHYNVDDIDESYFVVRGVGNMTLDDVMTAAYEDLLILKDVLPDDEPMKKAITWDKERKVNIPDDYLERLKKDVFYSSWEIESIDE